MGDAMDDAVWRVHPEANTSGGIEPTIGEELRLAEFLKGVDRASEADLRALMPSLARQLLVVYPATMRWLARSAAENLAGVSRIDADAMAHVIRRDLGLKDAD